MPGQKQKPLRMNPAVEIFHNPFSFHHTFKQVGPPANSASHFLACLPYLGYDIAPQKAPRSIPSQDPRVSEFPRNGRLPRADGSAAEIYFSLLTSDLLSGPVSPAALIKEAFRLLETGGYLIVYNGYHHTSACSIFITEKNRIVFRVTDKGVFTKQDRDNETSRLLNELFFPLPVHGYSQFFLDRGIGVPDNAPLSILIKRNTGQADG